MFGLRQIFRASLRLFPIGAIERAPTITPGHRSLLQTIESEGILQQFSTQINEQEQQSKKEPLTKHPVGKLEARMRVLFTCKKCNTRNSKTMTKLAYEKGVVIIRCDGCKNNHLIADNLGWFGPNVKMRNIEKIMKLKGETVHRLGHYSPEALEVVSKDEETEIKAGKAQEIGEVGIPDGNR